MQETERCYKLLELAQKQSTLCEGPVNLRLHEHSRCFKMTCLSVSCQCHLQLHLLSICYKHDTIAATAFSVCHHLRSVAFSDPCLLECNTQILESYWAHQMMCQPLLKQAITREMSTLPALHP